MYDSNSKGISYISGFFILIGFVVACFILAGLLSIPVWTAMTGTGMEKMSTEMDNPAYASAYQVIQIITSVVGFFLPALMVAFLLNRKPMRLLGFSGTPSRTQLFIVLLIALFGLFASTGLSYVNSHIPIPADWKAAFDRMEDEYNSGVESIVSFKSIPEFLFALFILAVLPAICEETLFRGGLQNFLTRATKMPWLSIIIVSIIFSLAHFSYYGFLSRFFLGIMLGLLYQYSGKIWLNIFAHFLNNGIAITALYVSILEGQSVKDAMNENAETFWGILALPVVILLFIWFYKVSAKERVVVQTPPPPPFPGPSGDLFS